MCEQIFLVHTRRINKFSFYVKNTLLMNNRFDKLKLGISRKDDFVLYILSLFRPQRRQKNTNQVKQK